jgi:hypothetical protein
MVRGYHWEIDQPHVEKLGGDDLNWVDFIFFG